MAHFHWYAKLTAVFSWSFALIEAYQQWKERLVHLCQVSSTEPQGITYYWGADIDGAEPDTLWGLEGYTHAVGFFMGHPSSEIFKREMQLVDDDKLLRHVQGLASPDYDLKHYDHAGGWFTRADDPDKYSTDSHVAVHHFFCQKRKRDEVIEVLCSFADETKKLQCSGGAVQSCGVLKECNDMTAVTLWLRYVYSSSPQAYTHQLHIYYCV
jgi:hypothetical protein